MVSMSVLALLMLLVFQMLEATQRTWTSSRARVSTFKEARVAFEGLTRRVGQAMLNTYFDYKYPGNDSSQKPTGYERKSDLHFISGQASDLVGDVSTTTHAVFFQAPLGFSLEDDNQAFTSLLNSWGYFIELKDDRDLVPSFLTSEGYFPRIRYRLMEFRPPAENMAVYSKDLKNNYSTDWISGEIGKSSDGGVKFSRPIAENIVALIIEPKESKANSSANTLAPNYEYDSRRFQKTNNDKDPTKHQLPPLVDVTMVAVDENSIVRYEQVNGSINGLVPSGLFSSANSYESDLRRLEEHLNDKNIDYRVFKETVAIRASKFSDSSNLP